MSCVTDFIEEKKRQILEEDESMDEDEFSKLKEEVEKNTFPDALDLPEDDTGPYDGSC